MKARKLDPTNCTLLELVRSRTGRSLRAAQVVAFILAWGQTRERLGRTPTVEEYAADWHAPLSSAYRERAYFREAFPGLDNPDQVLDVMPGGKRERFDASELVAA